jgi:hypothetical protein
MSDLKNKKLVGAWCSLDEISSYVQYKIDISNESFTVEALDTYDNEKGEISNIVYNSDKCELDFCCYWASTGRYTKCRFHLIEDDRVNFTYTYTDHEILIRKN